jgi:hypothetical protein
MTPASAIDTKTPAEQHKIGSAAAQKNNTPAAPKVTAYYGSKDKRPKANRVADNTGAIVQIASLSQPFAASFNTMETTIHFTQKEYAITRGTHRQHILVTGAIGPCLFISVYHPATKTALAIHYDDNTRKEALAAAFKVFLDCTKANYNELQVSIIGGNEHPSSRENAQQTIKFFTDNGIAPTTLLEVGKDFFCKCCTVFIDAKNGNIGYFDYHVYMDDVSLASFRDQCEHLDATYRQINGVPYSGAPLLPCDILPDPNHEADQALIAKAKDLCKACLAPDTKALSELLKSGAPVNLMVDLQKGRFPLHFVCALQKTEHARLLIQHGAQISLADKAAQFPLVLLKDPKARVELTKLSEETAAKAAVTVTTTAAAKTNLSSDLSGAGPNASLGNSVLTAAKSAETVILASLSSISTVPQTATAVKSIEEGGPTQQNAATGSAATATPMPTAVGGNGVATASAGSLGATTPPSDSSATSNAKPPAEVPAKPLLVASGMAAANAKPLVTTPPISAANNNTTAAPTCN